MNKFSSGSHSAKIGAGLNRKDIINTTFNKMRDNFGFASTKVALVVLISGKAGNCVGTRKLITDGKTIHLPPHDKGNVCAEVANYHLGRYRQAVVCLTKLVQLKGGRQWAEKTMLGDVDGFAPETET